MTKCLYPDCDGEIEPGATYCDECGRSQAPAQVAVATAGAQARVQAPAAVGVEPARPRPVRPPPLVAAPPPRLPDAITIPLGIGVALLIAILFLGCMGALAIRIVMSPMFPIPSSPTPGSALPPMRSATRQPGDSPFMFHASGNRTVTVVPAPGLVSRPTVPPWAVTISRTMARPRPLLPGVASGALPW
jgi:hypothetical protein